MTNKHNLNDRRHFIYFNGNGYLVELEVSETANPKNLTDADISILEIYNCDDPDGDDIFDDFCAYEMAKMRAHFASNFNDSRAEAILNFAELDDYHS